MSRPALLAAVAVATFVTAAACADEADPADAPSGGGTATVTEGLAALPADLGGASDEGEGEGEGEGDYATFTWSNLDRAAELAGVEPPADEGDVLAVADYVSAISGGPTHSGEPSPVVALLPETSNVYGATHVMDEFRDEVGWNVLDVDSFAEQDAPPVAITAMSGDFDPAAISEAMGEPEDGTWSVGKEGEISPEDVTAARPLGQALYLTEVGGGLAVSRGEDHTDALRGVAGDRDASVAADDTMAAVAGALDDAGAYSAMIVRPGLLAGGGALDPREMAAQCDASPQVPTHATATGIADDGGPVILVVEAYGSADDAEAGAAALEQVATDGESLATGQPWSELLQFEGVDTTGPDGTVAVMRLRPTEDGRASLWRDLILQRDNLVGYC